MLDQPLLLAQKAVKTAAFSPPKSPTAGQTA
jgi:hypothetical protein